MINKLAIFVLVCSIAFPCLAQKQNNKALDLVSKHTILFDAPPVKIPVQHSVDAPLLGNGSVAVALAGTPDKQLFYIARNDFWRLKSALDASYPAVLGKVELSIPALQNASYKVEQRLDNASTTATFTKGKQTVTYTTYVNAIEDLLLIELKLQGGGSMTGSIGLSLPEEGKEIVNRPPLERVFPTVTSLQKPANNIEVLERGFVEDVDIPTRAAIALRMLDQQDCSFELKSGKPVYIVCAVSSDFKTPDCVEAVTSKVASIEKGDLKALQDKHEQWWSDYWNKSYVTIPDKEIEKHYYLSLYGMGSCSRDADFAPSIFGSWITKERPFWNGDYHLNYNHIAPYYALYSANRLEQAMPYTNTMLPQLERGKHYSLRVTGIKDGIMLPVGAGPLGIETCRRDTFMENYYSGWIKEEHVQGDGFFMGQKSNSSYVVVNMSMHFYRTWDKSYTQRVYPFVKGVANFWKGYVSKQGDRYVIYNDAIHEGTVGTMNPILSLGLARMVLQTAIDMSEYLNEDAVSREVWADLKAKLSDFPIQQRDGKTVFRYTEKGVDWWGDNTLGIQHIYPAGQIGLASESTQLETAHNTIDVMQRWIDFNGSNSFFPAAVRVGYNADTILTKLNQYVNNTYPNGFQRNNPHGIENFSTTPNTINEMLCMGHQDVVRIFPVWPKDQDAAFERIRVEGAFLVSGRIKNGEIGPVVIKSEQGRPLILQNPWKDKAVKITSKSGDGTIQRGDKLNLSTQQGTTYTFTPLK